MLLLTIFACILFFFVCCVTSITVGEKKEAAKRKNMPSNTIEPLDGKTLLNISSANDPYAQVTDGDGEASKRSESYMDKPEKPRDMTRLNASPEEKVLFEFK